MRTKAQAIAAYNGLTPAEFGRAFFKTSVDQVYEWIQNGQLEAVDTSKTPGEGRARWKIPVSELERMRRERSNQATDDAA